MKIKHRGLHRIALLLGIVSIYILPDYFYFDYIIWQHVAYSPIFSDFWYLFFEWTLSGIADFSIFLSACIAVPLCFATGYFSVKIIVWVFNGFIEDK